MNTILTISYLCINILSSARCIKIVYIKFVHNDVAIDVVSLIGVVDANTEVPFQLKSITCHYVQNFVYNMCAKNKKLDLTLTYTTSPFSADECYICLMI